MLTKEQIDKLPKYAQEEIRVLQMRLSEAEAAARVHGGKEKTKLLLPHYGTKPGDNPLYLPDHETVRFVLGDKDREFVDFRLGQWCVPPKPQVDVFGGDGIMICPSAANHFQIRLMH